MIRMIEEESSEVNIAEKQQGEEALAAEKSGLGPKWLRKTSNGQKIEFVLDSGSVRTIVPPEVAKGMTTKKAEAAEDSEWQMDRPYRT